MSISYLAQVLSSLEQAYSEERDSLVAVERAREKQQNYKTELRRLVGDEVAKQLLEKVGR